MKIIKLFIKGNVEVKVGNSTTNSLAQGGNDFQDQIIVTEYRVNNTNAKRVNQVTFNDQVGQAVGSAPLAKPEYQALEDKVDMK